MTMRRAVLGIGANLGDRLAALQGAVDALCSEPGIEVVAVSPVVESDPVGGPEQPDFLNAVVEVRTTLGPMQLLELAQRIEHEWHRVRTERWGPRTLDIDIIAMEDLRNDDPVLTLPHPRAHERAFVIVPWRELDPDAHLPGVGAVRDLPVDTSGVRASALRISIQ